MRRVISLFFLLIMVAVSIHPMLNMHFCKGQLASVSIMKEAKVCCVDMGGNRDLEASPMQQITNENHSHFINLHKNCCSTRNVTLSTDRYNSLNQNLSLQKLLPSFTVTWVALHTLINYIESDTSVKLRHIFPPDKQSKLNTDLLTYICIFRI